MHDSYSTIVSLDDLRLVFLQAFLYWHKLKRDLQRSSCSLGLSGYEPKLTTLLRPELWRPEGHPQWDLW